ncbi:prolyl aminopeptidase [Actinoplanes sp. NPDC051470]|uniref:prolyl aminopeptidase n=1 Tax=unclassified Actinoplanes TaxID=2626549 RepID=UPI00343FD18D
MTGAVLDSGHLEVGDGHALYWEEWGAPDGVPVVCLHGGPGAAFNDTHKLLFDPARHRVLFFDQRGCGRSTPTGSVEHNTSADLVADIDALMTHRGWDTAHVAGGSWGSTLSLLFAIAHPARVRSLLLWSIYLLRRQDDEWLTLGGPRTHFPAEWETFIAPVPADRRSSGKQIIDWYAGKFRSPDPAEALRYARAWVTWELTLCSMNYDAAAVARYVDEDDNTVACAIIETHFVGNSGFVPENFILDSLDAVRHLPCRVVQGRFDMCTPPVEAYDLARAYGENLTLEMVNAGHLRTEPELMAALRTAAISLD